MMETEKSFAEAKDAAEKSEAQVSSLSGKLQETEELYAQKLKEASDKLEAECTKFKSESSGAAQKIAKLEKELQDVQEAQQDMATKQYDAEQALQQAKDSAQ